METKFTKGQWKLRFFGEKDNGENHFFVEGPNFLMPKLGYGIEIMMEDFGDHNGYPREQRLADAMLIAKAPELFEAIVGLQKRLEILINATPSGNERNIMTDENIKCIELINSCGVDFKEVDNRMFGSTG